MADVFKRFITNVTTTDLTTVFTVPTANVAATPPVPVSTFIVKTINTHNYDGSNSVTVNVDHNNGSADLQIFQILQLDLLRKMMQYHLQANSKDHHLVLINLLL